MKCEHGFDNHDCAAAYAKRIAELEAENARLKESAFERVVDRTLKKRGERIAELEAENARLKERTVSAASHLAAVEWRETQLADTTRERDEARAALEAEKAENDRRDSLRIDEILGLREMHGATLLELDEARAACAAKDEALRNVRINLFPHFMVNEDEWVSRHNSIVDRALSPTAGSDLLARLENAAADGKEELDMAHARIEELEARLEKEWVAKRDAALSPSAPRADVVIVAGGEVVVEESASTEDWSSGVVTLKDGGT